jgi:hypothetical protein
VGDVSKGVKQGAGFGCGCLTAPILIPLAIVLAVVALGGGVAFITRYWYVALILAAVAIAVRYNDRKANRDDEQEEPRKLYRDR